MERKILRRGLRLGALLALLTPAACLSPLAVDDPAAELSNPANGPRKQLGAMVALDRDPHDEAYLQMLEAVIYVPGYTTPIREAAFDRLAEYDLARLKKTVRQHLPRMGARAWQERCSMLIAERGWTDLSPALVSSWSNRIGFVDDFDRVEYQALVELYGPDGVIDAVFEMLVESNKPYQQGLRTRCWQLLDRLGQDDRLVELLETLPAESDDLMLVDLRAAVMDLGILPRTREEILWLRKLRQPAYSVFWSQAAAAVGALPESRRRELELRDIPIVVAASVHDPWLLGAGKDELYEHIYLHVRASRVHVDTGRFDGFPGDYPQRLFEHRDELTWGDLAAMIQAVRCVQVPQVADHLFDYAERDRQDRRTEYGGVIRLDGRDRFEILEFAPLFKRRDNEFIASQAMMDAAYTAVFHFHFHAQKHSNGRHAGPGVGDLNYADNVRANCLVLTFINDDTLNVDFYRHGRVIVDLGEVRRP